MKKKIPIGISDFKLLIEENYIYVDKSLFIQELVEKGAGRVFLIPRMRRFGKTLNLSMLRYFFEKTDTDTHHLFSSLNIWKMEQYRALQGQYPVISLSLKDIKYSSWDEALDAFQICVAQEFQRHRYLLEGDVLSQEEKEDYLSLLRKGSHQALFVQSLAKLSHFLERFYKRRVVLLIDEYDTPVHAAYIGGYYDVCIGFLRNWLSAGLKDNTSLEFGVLTGILRVAKESIFSGLNNISTFSILNDTFQDKFGFSEPEVQELVKEYDLLEALPQIRKWYDGYRVGSCTGMYNPWSVLKCIEAGGVTIPYWGNTSDNALIKELITQGTEEIKGDLEELLKGGVIEKSIEEGVAFEHLRKNPACVWSLLLFSGYLTLHSFPLSKSCQLKIPNSEVKEIYESMILHWFTESLTEKNYHILLKSLMTGDIETFSRIFEQFLLTSFSVFDVSQELPERVYHAFVLGMLVGLKDRYEIRSNRESGYGRYDVTLFPKNSSDLGIVMEFKKIDRFDKIDLETAAEVALKQIEEKKYATELEARGIKRILFMGLVFQRKNMLIKSRMWK